MATTTQASYPQAEESTNTRSILEIALVYGVIEANEWVEGPAKYWLYLLGLTVVIILGLVRRDLWPKLGLGTRGLLRSLWIVPAGAVLAGAILLAGDLAHTLHMPYHRLWYMAVAGYALWAFQQQYLLQSFFLTRFESILGDRRKALIAAVALFSFAHIPNPTLVLLTVVMAVVFCSLFQHYRNIYALALAHGMLGVSVGAAMPDWMVRHMRVGIGFLHYVKH